MSAARDSERSGWGENDEEGLTEGDDTASSFESDSSKVDWMSFEGSDLAGRDESGDGDRDLTRYFD